jgi:carboxyl-terminal processing protease
MNKMRSILLCLSILGCLLFSTPLWAAADPVLDEIKALVESYYLGDVDWDRLQVDSPEALVAELGDPHSEYLKAEEMEEFISSIEGNYAGIGVYLNAGQ